MSSPEVQDAVKFSIEGIEESVDLLEDDQYIEALQEIEAWCKTTWLKMSESIRNAGGRA